MDKSFKLKVFGDRSPYGPDLREAYFSCENNSFRALFRPETARRAVSNGSLCGYVDIKIRTEFSDLRKYPGI